MDTDVFQLTFLGAIDEDTETYKITYKYIRNIDFITVKSDFFNDSDDFNKHTNFLLIS